MIMHGKHVAENMHVNIEEENRLKKFIKHVWQVYEKQLEKARYAQAIR